MADEPAPTPPPTCYAYGMFEGKALRCAREPGHDELHAFVVKWDDSAVIDPADLLQATPLQAPPQKPPQFDTTTKPDPLTPIEADARLATALAEIGDDPESDAELGLDDGGAVAEELDLSQLDMNSLTPDQLRAVAAAKEEANHPAKCFSCRHPWHRAPCTAPLMHDGEPTEEACGCTTAVA